jgi:hypothetical protein
MAINFNGVKVISSGGGGGAASWPGDGSKLLSGDGTQVTVGSGLTFSAGQIAAEELTWPGAGSGMTAADGSLVTVGDGLSLSAGGLSASGIRKSYIATVGDSNTTLLLHGDGANNSTTFTDRSGSATPKVVTPFGNTKISTAASKFGSSSILFDGNGDYLRIPYDSDFNLLSTDFTFECWVNFNSIGVQGLLSKHTSGAALDYELAIINSTTIRFVQSNLIGIDATVPAMTTGTWYHIAFVKSSGNLSIYLNGTRRAGPTAATLTNNITSYVVIGASTWNTPGAFFNGYMNEARLSKVSRYSGASFTVPTAAFTNADGSAELSATSVGDTVYSSNGIYICTSLSPLTWKKFSVSSTITL